MQARIENPAMTVGRRIAQLINANGVAAQAA